MTIPNFNSPKINPLQLWQMDADKFNQWRRENDYPRIISFLKFKLPEFDQWLVSQEIDTDFLINYSPSTFLKEEDALYLYTLVNRDSKEREIVSTKKIDVNKLFSTIEKVTNRKTIIPYPAWYKKIDKKRPFDLYVNSRGGRSHHISELELLDLGNCQISNLFLGGLRHLDFVNISDLTILHCTNNSFLQLAFSSASNLSVQGDFPFVEAYKTSFYEVFNLKYNNLKLLNGAFHRWSFTDCNVNLTATNAHLQGWTFTGWDFSGTISNTDLQDCSFASSKMKYPISYGRAMRFHAQIKRLYSQIGRRKEASEHYYREKNFERKSFLRVRQNYQNLYIQNKTRISKTAFKVFYFFKYIYLSLINLLWGFGERPSRVFIISITTIVIFAFLYCLMPKSSEDTYHNFSNSLYYSMVTFTTLGYGDIIQKTEILKLLSGFEALLGMSFWGILIAGFTNNSKDY